MIVDFALLADAATLDSSGKLYILGVFDQINVARFPARHQRMSVVLRMSGGGEDIGQHKLTIRLKDPGGEEMFAASGEINVASGRSIVERGIRVPHVLNIDGVVLKKPGTHRVEILLDGRHEASFPLQVHQARRR